MSVPAVLEQDSTTDISPNNVPRERWYHEYLARKVSQLKNNPCPRIMGIDEHFFTCKSSYVTTICDLLSSHKVYDVVLWRSEAASCRFLRRCKSNINRGDADIW